MTFDVLGLTGDEELVYIALIKKPHCTSADLAAECAAPVGHVARILTQLVGRGLAARASGRPSRFSALPPDTAVSRLISERENRLAEARALVHRLAEMHREASRISDPDVAVELLGSREDVSATAHRLVAMAQHQVRAFDRPPYVDRPGHDVAKQMERQKLGIRHRVIYDRTALEWPGRLTDDIIPSMRAGEASRVHPELPLKLVIADDVAAIVPFSLARGGHASGYLVHRSPLLYALECLFEAFWEGATPIVDHGPAGPEQDHPVGHERPAGAPTDEFQPPAPEAQPRPAAQPDEHVRMLLSLLAAGLTDKSIARAMNWSERTTQRRIQQLMIRLGAVTRFQACLVAVRRGWL